MVDHNNTRVVTKRVKKVMIVDDDPFCTMLVKSMLESLGQIVDTADDGKLGVGMYQKNCKGYKFILMDIHMPEVDGYEATK